MRLDSEFLQLPLQFDAEQLAREAGAFLEGEWRPHPTDYKGNTSIILISSRGEQNDTFIGPMLPTPLLERCPYIQQVLASFNTVFGRSRLMRLDGGSEVPIHSDINYHWYYRVRLHIPIITDPAVRFFCNGYDVHMAPGEAWIFDTWKAHRVINPKHCARIHLVADTTGSPAFWDLARAARRPLAPDADAVFTPRRVEFEPGRKVEIETERFTHTVVMSPGEMDALAMDLIDDIDAGSPETRDSAASFIATVQWLRHEWRRTWTLHGDGAGSWGGYQAILKEARRRAESAGPEVRLASNRASAMRVLSARILSAAFQAQLAGMAQPGPAGPGAVTGPVPQDGPVAKIPKVGRNDDCPCGSGKKYKKCHGAVAV